MNEISTQDWIPFEEILDNGIIKINKREYIKIIKVKPINFNLKSELEKKAILNSYKTFLKVCNFNFQIFIQSNKEDISKYIINLNNNSNNESKFISEIIQKHITYINEMNQKNKSSSKKFYIIIKYINNSSQDEISNVAFTELSDNYFKIKENLSRCGNIVYDVNTKKDSETAIYSLFNTRLYFNYG